MKEKKIKIKNTLSAIGYRLSANSGYALLLSVIVSSIILAIGLGLLSILEKKIILASTTRDSQKAFYAADSGSECALYWDRKHQGFGSTVFATSTFSRPPGSGVSCNSEDIAGSWVISDVTATAAKTSFDLSFTNGSCSRVLVEKANEGRQTIISSRGFSVCDLSSPRVVERAIRVFY